jgi:hypothetical protein
VGVQSDIKLVPRLRGDERVSLRVVTQYTCIRLFNKENFMKNIVILVFFLLPLAACNSRDWADVGYSDGYAVGYKETCKIRATLIEGKWNNKEYKNAYELGSGDGAAACRKSNGN